jgi:hypothetical protein
MAENAYRYFIVESGDLLSKVKALLAEHDEVRHILSAFAEKYGAKSFVCNGAGLFAGRDRPRLCGLSPVRPIPAGWKLSRRGDYMEPYAKAKELLAEIKALPALPNLRGDISAAIGWETSYSSSSFPEHVFGRPTCQLIWIGDNYCICAPLHGQLGGMTSDSVKAAMAHPVPAGCREVTQAEWELIGAIEEVAHESGKAA